MGKKYRDQEKSRFVTFTKFLGFLTSMVIVFTVFVLFDVQTILDYLPSVNNDSLNLRYDLFLKIPIDSLLVAIAGALSAILAIVFSLTVISIQSISEKYTPYIIEKYRTNKQTRLTLYAFVLVIVSSLSLLLIKELMPAPTVIFIFLFLLFGVFLCFALLIKYFDFIFDIINPIKLASILSNESIDYIKNGKEKDKLEEIIITMGDISIKSLQRQEENIASHYISELYGIFLTSISEIKKLDCLNIILVSFQRILDYCIKFRSDLRFKIVDILSEIPTIILYTKDLNKFNENVFSEYANYLNKLFYVNKEIISENDYDLFKSEIHSISMRSVQDPKKRIDNIRNILYLNEFNIPQLHQDDEIKSRRKKLFISLENLTLNFARFEDFKNILDELDSFFLFTTKHLTQEGLGEVQKQSGMIREILFKFYLDSNLHKTFFVVGAYCIFTHNESDKYLRELWSHTNPEDAVGITCNEVPVSSDIQYLCNILFYGGDGNGFWYNDYSFEGFHESKMYLYKYFLLLLTNLRETQNKELIIKISNDADQYELEFSYSFLKRFNSEVKELIEYCDDLIQESGKWALLFPTKSQQNTETELREITAKVQFENTKKWLEEKKSEFEKKIKEIETYLPLDAEKVGISKTKILESFNEFSEISKAARLEEIDLSRDKEIEFIQIYYRPIIPKDCFLAASYVDCLALWHGYGGNVAFGEVNYFVEQILDNSHIEKIEVDYDENIIRIYDKIESTINSLKDDGFNPSTIFIPCDYLGKLWHEEWNTESKLYGKYTCFDRQFKLNESTKLDAIYSSKYTEFEDIIILDKKACIWTFKPDEIKERLHIEINEYDKDISKISLSVKTEINLKIENSNAIKILTIKK